MRSDPTYMYAQGHEKEVRILRRLVGTLLSKSDREVLLCSILSKLMNMGYIDVRV